MKKILTIIAVTILIMALAFCVGWAIKNKDKIVEIANGANLYTEKDMEKAYNKGKEENLNALKEYEKQVLDLKNKIETLTIEKNKLAEDKNKEIEELNSQIETLKTSLNEYKTLLESIQNEDFHIVTFDNDENLSFQIVLKNDFAKVPTTPVKQGYIFSGWMIENEIVDVATYQITQNITFVAKFEKSYQIAFKVENEIVSIQTLISGQNIEIPTEPTKEYYTFKGWSENGVDVVEISTAIKDMTYIAVFENEHYLILTYSNNSKEYIFVEGNVLNEEDPYGNINDVIIEAEIPTCVEHFSGSSLQYLVHLEKLTIPKSVIYTENILVRSQLDISEINILNENINIKNWIFSLLSTDVTINFAGTKSQWAQNCPNSYSELISTSYKSTGVITVNCIDGTLTFSKNN